MGFWSNDKLDTNYCFKFTWLDKKEQYLRVDLGELDNSFVKLCSDNGCKLETLVATKEIILKKRIFLEQYDKCQKNKYACYEFPGAGTHSKVFYANGKLKPAEPADFVKAFAWDNIKLDVKIMSFGYNKINRCPYPDSDDVDLEDYFDDDMDDDFDYCEDDINSISSDKHELTSLLHELNETKRINIYNNYNLLFGIEAIDKLPEKNLDYARRKRKFLAEVQGYTKGNLRIFKHYEFSLSEVHPNGHMYLIVGKYIGDGKLIVPSSQSRSEALKLNETERFAYDEDYLRAEEFLGLKKGDFTNHSFNHIYTGEDAELIQKLFDAIERGIAILPSSGESTRHGRRHRSGKPFIHPPPRTWGQAYLNSKSPVLAQNGGVFVDGSSCIAYHFDDKVIVEFDKNATGTYVFKKDLFETLRTKSRAQLLKDKPEGFIVRVIHVKNDESKWKKKIDELFTS